MVLRKQGMKTLQWIAAALVAGGLVACGGNDSGGKKTTPGGGGDCPTDCAAGTGAVTAAATGSDSVTVSFPGAEVGSQYVVMPFLLGDLKTVVGGNPDQFTFAVSTAAAAGGAKLQATLQPIRREAFAPGLGLTQAMAATTAADGMDAQGYDEGLRLLWNRYDPRRGADQGAGFWETAQSLDRYSARHAAPVAGGNLRAFGAAAPQRSIERYFRAGIEQGARRARPLQLLTATGDCPEAGGPHLTVPKDSNAANFDEVAIPAGGVVVGDDYCIVYASTPVTESDKAAIEATVKEVMRRYKTIIYKDELKPVGGYVFKPVIAIVDFKDKAVWPSAINFSGGFIAAAAEETNVPMIYMPSDLSKIDGAEKDNAVNRPIWHSTIAHEMQHAISHYYHVHVNKVANETLSIDEGLAHLMEDLTGGGQRNFSGHQQAFLQTWAGGAAVLDATKDSKTTRGGTHALLYYLVGQKGGVTFANGVVSGGPGLDFLAAVVKAPKLSGPENLSAQFGGTWTDTIGNFFGALALDGTKVDPIDPKYLPQEPQDIKDLNGAASVYGMKFNGFGGQSDTPTWDKPVDATPKTDEAPFYATNALLYTVKDPAASVTFKASDVRPNTAVSVVRIK